MLVLSRDGAWLARLESLAGRGGWPFEARAALPAPGRTPPAERALVVLDRAIAGAVPLRAVAALRAAYPLAAIVLVIDESEMGHDGVMLAVSCGADEILGKHWLDAKIALRLAGLRDRSLASHARHSADGALKVERRAHRALLRIKGRWTDLALDAGGFAMLWCLLEREGEGVSRAELSAALAAAAGRELDGGAVARRLAALKKALAGWPGSIVTARGGLYRLVSASRGKPGPNP